MPISDEFLEFVLDQFAAWHEVSARKMFGGAGLYADGVMFALIADDVVYLKVDDSNRAAFEAVGCGPFRPYPDKSTTMSYYEMPADILESGAELSEWASRSLIIARKAKSK